MEDNHIDEGEQKLENEVAPALIAVHPHQKYVSTSVGSDLRVFNLSDGSGIVLVDENGGHKDSIRAVRYSKSGRFLVSGGDDKLVKIWDTSSWRCIYSVVSEKRVTSLAISNDDMFVCFADKFGVIYIVDIGDYDCENRAPVNKKPVPILSHYCSIITRLEFSLDGKYIVSADRDFKIRVTVFPKNPLAGVHEIQSFCLGHSEFVSCLAFVTCQDNAQGFLVSGGGDSTVRLWDLVAGALLDTCEVGAKAGLLNSEQSQEEILPAVTDLCATSDGSIVAAAIQNLPGIMLLRCNPSSKTLFLDKIITVKGETFIPTSIATNADSIPFLWMVMGASSDNSPLLTRVRVLSGFSANSTESATVLEDNKVPGGEAMLEKLQGKLSIGEEAFKIATEAVKTAMHNLLIKKQYSSERRELRKKGRNDKKNQIPS